MVKLRMAGSAKAPQNDEPLPLGFTILRDNNEQAPWTFDGLRHDASDKYRPMVVSIEVVSLYTGDYSLKGYENDFTIERKSVPDLFGTLSKGRQRFEDEHERMRAMILGGGFSCVIIEGDLDHSLSNPPSQLNPKTVHRTFIQWNLKYRVPWYWCGSRRAAEVTALRLMQAFNNTLAKPYD